MHPCPICQQSARYTPFGDDRLYFECEDCGKLRLTGTAVTELDNFRTAFDPIKLRAVVQRLPRDDNGWAFITEYHRAELIAQAREEPDPVCPHCGR